MNEKTFHSYIKQKILTINEVNIYIFNNILCNLISKNNFDYDNKKNKKYLKKNFA